MVDRSLEVTWTGKDGEYIQKGVIFGTVKGSAQGVLVAERVALNFIQRMSGIATATHLMCKEVQVNPSQLLSDASYFKFFKSCRSNDMLPD